MTAILRQHLYLTMKHFPLLQAMKHTKAPADTSEREAASDCSSKCGLEVPGSGSKSSRHTSAPPTGGPHFVPLRLYSLRPSSGTASQSRGGNRLPQRRVRPRRQPPLSPGEGPASASRQHPFPAEAPQAEPRPGGRHTESAAPQPQRGQPTVAPAPLELSLPPPPSPRAARLKAEPGHPPPALRRLSGKLR